MEPKLIKCPEGCEEGMVAIYDHKTEQECFYLCGTCNGCGYILDDTLENILNDLVTAKEKNYEND